MMMKNSLSVVIPTHNRKDELLRAIESVRSQSLPPCEIIVVDDKSDFSVTKFLAERYGQDTQVITNTRNVGPGEARNIGVSATLGEFVAFLDSDDYWSPDKLEKQLAIFHKGDSVGLVYCDQWRIDREGVKRLSGKKMVQQDLWRHLLAGWTAPNTSTLVFRRSVFLALGGFDSRLCNCEDHDLWMRIAKAGIRVAYSPERLSYFSGDSSFRLSQDYDKRLKGMQAFLLKWERAIIESNGRKDYRRFRTDYENKVAFPLMWDALRKRKILRGLSLFRRYLVFNGSFYRWLGRALVKRLKQVENKSF